MNILVTGAKGFVGKNLCEALKNLRDGKDRTRPELKIENIFEYDIDGTKDELEGYCEKADFVFNLAGVNRPKNPEEFKEGNFGFASLLLKTLKKKNNTCPVMLSSSIQATLIGRYDSDYGRSKKEGEELFFAYGKETGAEVFVYRFYNIYGKWCRPNYNSAVATFCYNKANDLAITVSDENALVTLVYIDDLVNEMLSLLCGKATRCEFDALEPILKENGRYCTVREHDTVTLGKLVSLIENIKNFTESGEAILPMLQTSFERKLYATYLSYLPKEKAERQLKVNADARGSFTELVRTQGGGQFSVNVSNPGIKKGEHWHNTKWEIFIVISGHGLIRQRKIGSDEIIESFVDGKTPTAVYILPGYTHNIINLSETEPLVTFMWANECFDQNHPDTFAENV